MRYGTPTMLRVLFKPGPSSLPIPMAQNPAALHQVSSISPNRAGVQALLLLLQLKQPRLHLPPRRPEPQGHSLALDI
jgi:hypothetical protein